MDTNEPDSDVVEFAHLMFELARSGKADELSLALAHGLPANLTNHRGDTLLMLAAYHDHPATVRVLLAAGADTSRTNDRGQTALGAGVFRQNDDTVRALLAAGADPDAGGPSAREMAAFFTLPAMAAMLDESGRPKPRSTTAGG